MFSYNCNGEFKQDGPTTESLGPGTAPSRLLRKADLPDDWQPIPVKSIGIELRDTPWGRTYFAWATRELRLREDTAEGKDCPGVMLASMANFREPEDPRAAAAQCLRLLLAEGRPPREHIFQLLHQA